MTIAVAEGSYKTAEKLATTSGHATVSEYLDSLIDEAETLAAIHDG